MARAAASFRAPRRLLRPVDGAAIAATVALAAIVGLQQVGGFTDADVAPVAETTDTPSPSYTVPEVHRGLHEMEAGDLDALRATFEQRAEEIAEPDAEDDAAEDDAATTEPVDVEQTP